MRPSYSDIRALTDQESLWFTKDGVPRYQPFYPKMLGVYDRSAVLVEIECGSCGRRMLIGDGTPAMTLFRIARGEFSEITLERFAKSWVAGDPPRHDCPGAGETMSANEVAIIEAWERTGSNPDAWVRRTDMEGPIADPVGEAV